MANANRGARASVGAQILGLLNPIRDPSLLVGIILTVIWEGSSGDPPYKWVLVALLSWIAVKAFIWLFVNFAFSFVYLLRKASWAFRHPRLAWRLLDAMGTEEIIIGGLRPDMFATEDGTLHEGQLAYAGAGMPGYYGGAMGGQGQQGMYGGANGGYADYGNPHAEQVQQFLGSYSQLIGDWMGFTEEKWRAVSDSQLGWKPLRGRWNGWEEIFGDAFAAGEIPQEMADAMARRFDIALSKGSAASAVACFMHDLDSLRQSLLILETGGGQGGARPAGLNPAQPITQRTGKAPIIKNPRIVDAD